MLANGPAGVDTPIPKFGGRGLAAETEPVTPYTARCGHGFWPDR